MAAQTSNPPSKPVQPLVFTAVLATAAGFAEAIFEKKELP